MPMTLAELQAETLVQKHKRLMQERCSHEDTYSSSVYSAESGKTFTNKFCFECGQVWRSEEP